MNNFIQSGAARIKRFFGAVTKSILGSASTVFFHGAQQVWESLKSTKAKYSAAYWLRKFNENSILQRPVRRLMEDFASVKFELKRKRRGKNGRIVLEDVFEHPAMRLLDRPNPTMTGHQFRELWEQSLTLTGQFLVYIEFGRGGKPKALWPIGADKIHKTPDPAKGRKNWEFLGPTGEKIPAGPESVMWMKLVDGANIYGLGVGLCTAISRQIQMYESATDWFLNFFKNGSHVGAIVHIPDLEDGEGLQKHWEKNHTGGDNAHKTLFITTKGEGQAKVTVHRMGASHRDMDFSQGINDLKDQVRENFNLPAELVGDSKNTNRAASTASENFHQKNNIRPRALRGAAFLNCFYLPMWGEDDLVITFVDPVQEDMLIASKTMLDGVKNGCAKPDEWRELRGMEPWETSLSQGQMFPLNMTIVDEDGNVLLHPKTIRERGQKPPLPDGDQAPQPPENESIEKQLAKTLAKVASSMEALQR
ncbi:MAG: phage portal protein [Vulcanimicrobiota bacterium]